MEPLKKHTIPTTTQSQKKETQLLVDYYEGHPVSPESLEKLHKPAKRILEKKDMVMKIN